VKWAFSTTARLSSGILPATPCAGCARRVPAAGGYLDRDGDRQSRRARPRIATLPGLLVYTSLTTGRVSVANLNTARLPHYEAAWTPALTYLPRRHEGPVVKLYVDVINRAQPEELRDWLTTQARSTTRAPIVPG
jgi:hypothetical protein